jgi:hypothetical protein
MEWIGIEKQFGYCGLVHRNYHLYQNNVLSTPEATGRSFYGELKLLKLTYKISWFSCQIVQSAYTPLTLLFHLLGRKNYVH